MLWPAILWLFTAIYMAAMAIILQNAESVLIVSALWICIASLATLRWLLSILTMRLQKTSPPKPDQPQGVATWNQPPEARR